MRMSAASFRDLYVKWMCVCKGNLPRPQKMLAAHCINTFPDTATLSPFVLPRNTGTNSEWMTGVKTRLIGVSG
jgi:hypothetical protein